MTRHVQRWDSSEKNGGTLKSDSGNTDWLLPWFLKCFLILNCVFCTIYIIIVCTTAIDNLFSTSQEEDGDGSSFFITANLSKSEIFLQNFHTLSTPLHASCTVFEIVGFVGWSVWKLKPNLLNLDAFLPFRKLILMVSSQTNMVI